MSDSIRWDHHPDYISKKGLTFKTIASSLFTPPSHASMLTGKYPHNHGVSGFFDTLSESHQTILDKFPNSGLSDVRGTFHDKIQGEYFNEAIYNTLLNRYEQIPLSDIEEPFAWFMRDPGGHAPYGGWDLSMNVAESVPKFFKRYAGDTEALHNRYNQGIELSVERFKKHVIKPLEKRDLLDDTLIVFLSDHGEQLGEFGHSGQSFPATPEVVYVPTTFIHPDIDTKMCNKLFRHIDLPATIANLMGIEWPSSGDGKNVLNHEPDWGYSLISRTFPSFRGTFDYTIKGIWDKNGGHVLNTSSAWNRFKLTGGYISKIPSGKQLLKSRNLFGFKLLLETERTWGDPSMSKNEAKQKLKSVDMEAGPELDHSIDRATKEHLKELGYR